MKGAKVDFYRGFYAHEVQPHPLLSLTSNDAGIATATNLSSGDYRVYVRFEGIRSAIFDGALGTWLYLHVHNKHGVSRVSADLAEAAQQLKRADEDFERKLDDSDQTAKSELTSDFCGIIIDPSGARVPDVKIFVTKKVSGVWTALAQTTSDSKGQFFDQLNDGRYVAVFSASGFRVAIVPFEISASGFKNLLKIRLEVGAITE